MAISIDRYVAISSQVGGAASVDQRELIGRLFSSSAFLPPNQVLEFSDLTTLGEFFGTTSEEYLRSVFYFTFTSKRPVRNPNKISFYRWVSADSAPQIYGSDPDTLAALNLITAGSITITAGAFIAALTAVNLASAASFADVATTIQSAVQSVGASDVVFATATVAYDAVNARFVFTGSDTGDFEISVADGAGTSLVDPLGWGSEAIFVNGAVTQTITEAVSDSANISTNFGSFAFIPTLTIDEIEEAAIWNQGENTLYMYGVAVLAADAVAWQAQLAGISGTGLTLYDDALTEYPEMAPMLVLAATNYAASNSVQNYMFQEFDALTPLVTDDTTADLYDGIDINYYGQSQEAGNVINFYQRGKLLGGATDAVNMNTYANEIWLKTRVTAQLMSLFLNQNRVPANNQGISFVVNIVSGVADEGLFNGTISTGRTLTVQQIAEITLLTGSDTAFQQIVNSGYYVTALINNSDPENIAIDYQLIYAKDDVVRKINGTHTLI